MKRRARQFWYRLRDGFRDRVWVFADRIDPAVGQERLARAELMDELQRFAMIGMSRGERLHLLIFATPTEVAEAALRRAAEHGFEGPLAREAERARDVVA